jgi:hypothetical protein
MPLRFAARLRAQLADGGQELGVRAALEGLHPHVRDVAREELARDARDRHDAAHEREVEQVVHAVAAQRDEHLAARVAAHRCARDPRGCGRARPGHRWRRFDRPERMPASAAGEPSIGAITITGVGREIDLDADAAEVPISVAPETP